MNLVHWIAIGVLGMFAWTWLVYLTAHAFSAGWWDARNKRPTTTLHQNIGGQRPPQ